MLSESQLAALVRAIDHRSAPLQAIDAGYTYFGQFVAHELVSDSHPGGRIASSRLDLDSLYGRDAAVGRFEIGPNLPDGPHDLLRQDGVAKIPDRRNDDTVILAQLHLLWQRVHNYLMDNNLARDPEDARRLVVSAFQLLLVEDYLRLILLPEVFDAYFRSQDRWLGLNPLNVPKEFSLAAFRFGHSMVRPFYESFPSTPSDIPLADLFRAGQPLEQRFEIDWRHFFGWPVPNNAVQDAMAIGPSVTSAMTKVPVRHRGVTVNIVEANLRAGDAAGLNSGHAHVRQILRDPHGRRNREKFHLEPLEKLSSELQSRLPDGSGITIENLPLWPYILLEADVTSGGRRLGMLGSLLCAETLSNAILSARYSIYSDGRPESVDRVLARMGEFGERIQSTQAANARHIEAAQLSRSIPSVPQRSLCMRHLVELIDAPPRRRQ